MLYWDTKSKPIGEGRKYFGQWKLNKLGETKEIEGLGTITY